MAEKSKRIGVLDGLRGVAVLIVFLSHTSGRGQSVINTLNFQGIGLVGVYLFFSLSAYLLGYKIYTRNVDKRSVLSFYLKRFLRIVPLYYFVISMVFMYQKLTNSYEPRYLHISGNFKGFLEHLVFYRGDGVFWSIVSEMQFYLIVPLVAYLLLKRTRFALIILSFVSLLSSIVYTGYYAHIIEILPYVSPNTLNRGTFMDIFLIGMLGAWFIYKRPDLFQRYRDQLSFAALFSFVLVMLLTLVLVSKSFLFFNQPLYKFRYVSIIYSVCFTLVILSLVSGNKYLEKFFGNRFLRLLGQVGFSFYLIHFAVLLLVNQYQIASPLKFLISFCITLFLSKGLFLLIEKPSIRLSYKLIRLLKLGNGK
jgi:peptidoglycan/LPS O-acetylase OafA/YrhL